VNTVTVQTPLCYHCKMYGEVVVDREGYDKWIAGYLIQDALPELSIALREQMISGTHEKCWDEMMKPLEDENL